MQLLLYSYSGICSLCRWMKNMHRGYDAFLMCVL